ncbi:ABC transporter substrate-binding protein [Parahaliea mediterranea]|uniref:ABC transporter substrate-binding protein n=1 Tax=Parahaliea mediterranea TaxID=651086 RepID=UPI000E2FC14C|nr:ABC transporter substrate-binding protein [Parahaliea mediterranea]
MNILKTVAAGLGFAAVLSACGDTDNDKHNTGQVESKLTPVTFNMSWLPQGSMAGVIVAMDQGFYAEEGLAVSVTRGFGGIRTMNELDQGMFEFGYGDPLAIILNRSNGGNTRMIGALNQRWPAGLCYIAERHTVDTPADLAGLIVGGGQNSPVQAILPAWLAANNLPRDTVTMMQLDPSVIAASLIEGDIDAGECWLGNSLAVYQKRAAEAGLSVGWIEYSQFNLDIYGSGLATTDKLINEHPALVQGFVDATYRGYAWMRDNPQQATDIMQRQFPVLNREVTAQQIAEMSELLGSAEQLGRLEEGKVGNTLAFLSAAYAVDKALETKDVYTMQFFAAPAGE